MYLGRVLRLRDGLERMFVRCWGGCLPRIVNTRQRRLSHNLPHHSRIMGLMYYSESVATPSVTIVSAMSSGSTDADSYLEQSIVILSTNTLLLRGIGLGFLRVQ